ncbi:MAG TPA: tRNA (adenosine(37)-N6)-threonylcarbamoyltransferase complex dimerization subunit type 1 TsaB [Candidatus Chromulinivoraceae bacterium]|nr:tRNA (adenosine(37)-N6)-threonylcarbamoyltransferase complex dimerization subunit type 1 TsaB [Candidatus Chromulinivoraceae bacterium]
MILLLDTSTPVCKLSLIDGDTRYENEWQADRQLAKGLLAYLHDQLESQDKVFSDLTGIGAFAGPGSFTGLRIGLTVLNTLADSEHIPIVGGMGEDWQAEVLQKLENGKNEHIVLPFYGSEANITTPRK